MTVERRKERCGTLTAKSRHKQEKRWRSKTRHLESHNLVDQSLRKDSGTLKTLQYSTRSRWTRKKLSLKSPNAALMCSSNYWRKPRIWNLKDQDHRTLLVSSISSTLCQHLVITTDRPSHFTTTQLSKMIPASSLRCRAVSSKQS